MSVASNTLRLLVIWSTLAQLLFGAGESVALGSGNRRYSFEFELTKSELEPRLSFFDVEAFTRDRSRYQNEPKRPPVDAMLKHGVAIGLSKGDIPRDVRNLLEKLEWNGEGRITEFRYKEDVIVRDPKEFLADVRLFAKTFGVERLLENIRPPVEGEVVPTLHIHMSGDGVHEELARAWNLKQLVDRIKLGMKPESIDGKGTFYHSDLMRRGFVRIIGRDRFEIRNPLVAPEKVVSMTERDIYLELDRVLGSDSPESIKLRALLLEKMPHAVLEIALGARRHSGDSAVLKVEPIVQAMFEKTGTVDPIRLRAIMKEVSRLSDCPEELIPPVLKIAKTASGETAIYAGRALADNVRGHPEVERALIELMGRQDIYDMHYVILRIPPSALQASGKLQKTVVEYFIQDWHPLILEKLSQIKLTPEVVDRCAEHLSTLNQERPAEMFALLVGRNLQHAPPETDAHLSRTLASSNANGEVARTARLALVEAARQNPNLKDRVSRIIEDSRRLVTEAKAKAALTTETEESFLGSLVREIKAKCGFSQ